MARFFSVQTPVDAARLAAGGLPWPTGLQRAKLGAGFYAWASLADAEHYRETLERHGVVNLRIVVYEVSDPELAAMTTLDLTQATDDAVNAWMERHSLYGAGTPHDWQHVARATDKGIEHYFAPSVFGQFREVA